MNCTYCEKSAVLVTGNRVYKGRPDLASKKFWTCSPCDALVGCHPGTDQPLGTMANKDLRDLRQQAHRLFDPFWKGGAMRRNHVYAWLAKELSIPVDNCHIGMFNDVYCRKAIEILLTKKPPEDKKSHARRETPLSQRMVIPNAKELRAKLPSIRR